MDFAAVPMGFGMMLAQSEAAMIHYYALNEEKRQAVLSRARNARSEGEMWHIVAELANGTG